MSLRRKLFYAFTVAVIALMLILPTTGWLARMQLLPMFFRGFVGWNLYDATHGAEATDDPCRTIAERHPCDFELQYPYALEADRDEALRRLDRLAQRYPNDPRVIAAQLSAMTMGDDDRVLQVNRLDENALFPIGKEALREEAKRGHAPDPAMLARVDALATAGERAEPDNAFFPAVHAVGYFAAHRDAEGIAAWKRASDRRTWNDYTLLDMRARTQMLRALNGGNEPGSFARLSEWTVVLPRYLPQLRSAARVATVLAIHAELAGNAEEGLAIRRASRRLGETIQTQSSTYGGNKVGSTIIFPASLRPGGAPPIDVRAKTHEEYARVHELRIDTYLAYLKRIGHVEEASAFAAAHRAGESINDISGTRRIDNHIGDGVNTYRLWGFWEADLLLISGALFSLAFGAIFAGVYRCSPGLQKGEALPTPMKWGLVVSVYVPVAFAAIVTYSDRWSAGLWIAYVIGALCPLIASSLWLRFRVNEVTQGVLVMLCGIGSLVALGVVSVFAAVQFLGLELFGPAFAVNSVGDNVSIVSSCVAWASSGPSHMAYGMAFLPVLMLLLFALFSRMIGVPVAAGVTRGMRALSVPLACIFLLGWAGCVVATVREENAVIRELNRIEQRGELQAYAEQTGKPLPVPDRR